jgi:hypothetical protein
MTFTQHSVTILKKIKKTNEKGIQAKYNQYKQLYVITHLRNVHPPGVRFDAAGDQEEEMRAKDIAIRVELKAVESSIFVIITPANEKTVSEYMIENR